MQFCGNVSKIILAFIFGAVSVFSDIGISNMMGTYIGVKNIEALPHAATVFLITLFCLVYKRSKTMIKNWVFFFFCCSIIQVVFYVTLEVGRTQAWSWMFFAKTIVSIIIMMGAQFIKPKINSGVDTEGEETKP